MSMKQDSPEGLVVVRQQGSVRWLTLNCPQQRNALDVELLEGLNQELADLRDDDRTRVVVLTGAPPIFCAGAKARVKAGSSEEERRNAFKGQKSPFRRLFERATSQLDQLEQITIAMVNGHAVGAGWGLALACDFIVASDHAEFWIPEVDLGVLLGVGSTTRMVRAIGPARSKQIVLLGQRQSAQALQAMGLVHDVAGPDALEERTHALAEALAAKPFMPLAQMKARINAVARNATPEVSVATEHFLER